MISRITQHIIYTLQLKGIGVKMARKIFNLSEGHSIESNKDYVLFVLNEVSKFKGFQFSESEFSLAISAGDEIIEESFRLGINIISEYDELYPKRFIQFVDRPLIINYLGSIESLSMSSMGIIGSRKASTTSLNNATFLGAHLAEKGYNIISGLALGCDSAAHSGAITVNGITSAILPCGLDIIHPKSNEKLAEQILDSGGLLISEYFIGIKPIKGFYVRRDLLQGLFSDYLITVQSKIDGGSMYASNYALELNKQVAIFDFDENDPDFSGNLQLRNKGAFVLNRENINEFTSLKSKELLKNQNQLKLF